MDVLPIPLALFTGQNGRQLIQNVNRFVRPDQMLDLIDIPEDLLLRNTHQLLNIRTDIFHAKIICIQHQKDIVHIDGQLGEQLVTGKQLVVLPFQLLPVLLDHQHQKHHGQRKGNAGYNEHGRGLQLVHAGIDYIGGYNS